RAGTPSSSTKKRCWSRILPAAVCCGRVSSCTGDWSGAFFTPTNEKAPALRSERPGTFYGSSNLDQILERLEGGRADLLGRGLRRDRHGLLGERIDALALLGGGLLDHTQLHQAGHHELARTAGAQLLL